MGRACLERCPECPSRKLSPEETPKIPVAGDGPIDAEVVFVGEAPGKEENNRHRPFVGKTGEEFNLTYLPRAGMSRSEVYMTNTVKCHWADSSDAPPEHVVKSCAEFHLAQELKRIKPRVVVLMGSVANSLMGWDIDQENGVYHKDQTLLGYKCDIYSTFHPALGMHMSNKMQALLDDFRRLRDYMRGKLQPLKNACPNPKYAELKTAAEVDDAFDMAYDQYEMAVDTEAIKRWRGFKGTEVYTPDRLTFCIEPPYAWLVMKSSPNAMKRFAKRVKDVRRMYMHNEPYDRWACKQMEVEIPWCVYDTMSGAYHDGRLPKGLKPLGYKLAGIRMTSFDDVVVPYGYELAVEYLWEAKQHEWLPAVQEPTGEMVTRNCPDCKGKGFLSVGRGKLRRVYECDCDIGKVTVPAMTRRLSLNQSVNRIFTDIEKGPVKVWERWNSWAEKEHMLPALKQLVATMGPIPLPSIDYVPADEAMVYACGDALVTRIIGPIIRSRVAQIRRSVR